MKRYQGLAVGLVAFMVGASAFADSITPTSVSLALDQGESATITKTVTVDAGVPTSSKVDVYFMVDTTGSMYGEIAAVKASASSILSSASALGDVSFAVGEYKDFGDVHAYRLNTDIGGDASVGINMLGASGGGDYAEAQLYALTRAANETAWRPGSERIIVWFGDAGGHDPSGGATLTSTIVALNSESIAVEAVDVGSLNRYGQATAIASGTGGTYYPGISSADIVDTINAAITTAVSTYSTVGIDDSEVPAGVTVTVAPTAYSGSFDRSDTETYTFDVTFTGDSPGTYDFNLYGTVDGGRVATEVDRVVVRDVSSPVPDLGSTLALIGCALTGLGAMRRKLS